MSAPEWGVRLRWAVATHANKCPTSCWAHLVTWVQGGNPTLREAMTSGRECRAEAAACPHGCCYCGKYREETG